MSVVFHWQPSEMDTMSLDELMSFRKMAQERNKYE
ncbi:GpE family phage tail protein [Bathymodiolus septemdierum thioautotrophic gill symbiont]|nr:GpE family phage tail protein [Bathymodiolus septemdierum thioautotrophic gill symbiont]